MEQGPMLFRAKLECLLDQAGKACHGQNSVNYGQQSFMTLSQGWHLQNFLRKFYGQNFHEVNKSKLKCLIGRQFGNGFEDRLPYPKNDERKFKFCENPPFSLNFSNFFVLLLNLKNC